jgi:hypothetical protein
VLGPGAHAIGTNKIVGTSGALIAYLVYRKREKVSIKLGGLFLLGIALGALLGSLATPHLPKEIFRWLLIAICPVVLWVLYQKNVFIQAAAEHVRRPEWVLFATGAGVGFYDGFFGPGGGTFMLLGLLWAARLSLFEALLLSKLANTLSAGTSLISYGVQGFVHPMVGAWVAVGMVTGGYFGALFATKRAEKIVRPVLIFVVALLLVMQVRAVVF